MSVEEDVVVDTTLPTKEDNHGTWEYGYERVVFCPNCNREAPIHTIYRGGDEYTYVEDRATCLDCETTVKIQAYESGGDSD